MKEKLQEAKAETLEIRTSTTNKLSAIKAPLVTELANVREDFQKLQNTIPELIENKTRNLSENISQYKTKIDSIRSDLDQRINDIARLEKQKNVLFQMLKSAQRKNIKGHKISFSNVQLDGHVSSLSIVVQMYRQILNVDAAFGIFVHRKRGNIIVSGRSGTDGLDNV